MRKIGALLDPSATPFTGPARISETRYGELAMQL